MDSKEQTMVLVIRSLIRRGVLSFIASGTGAVILGPYGFMLGAAVAEAIAYFTRTDAEQATLWEVFSTTNGVISLLIRTLFALAVDNISLIVEICKKVIRFLQRLFEERANERRIPIEYGPSYSHDRRL